MNKINNIEFFCALPWMSINSRVDGDLSICCMFDNLKFEDQYILNFELDDFLTISELRNSEIFNETRKTIINNKIPRGCQKCYNDEMQGIISKRQIEKEIWRECISEEEILKNTHKDGSISDKHVHLLNFDIVLGNNCNLKCRMCRPELSINLFDEHKKLFGNNMLLKNRHLKIKKKKDLKFDGQIIINGKKN